jgi:integrase
LAFEFLVLTASRSSEVRLAMWAEMKLESATWEVPEERMKARREHRVPLTERALEILAQARELDGEDSGLVFPTGRRRKALSDMTFTLLLRRLGIPAVPHGFRSSFKEWCMEIRGGDERWFLSEAALAHNLGDATELAYARTDLLQPRRPLMDEWAEFLQGEPPEGRTP